MSSFLGRALHNRCLSSKAFDRLHNISLILKEAKKSEAAERKRLNNAIERRVDEIFAILRQLKYKAVMEPAKYERFGGDYYYYRGNILFGDPEFYYTYSEWSDSDGIGGNPPVYHLKAGKHRVEIDTMSAIRVSRDGKNILNMNDEDKSLLSLAKVNVALAWTEALLKKLLSLQNSSVSAAV